MTTKKPNKVFERIAQKDHDCAYGNCGCRIKAGDRIYEVTYIMNGGHWYTEYYHYNCW